MKSLTRYWFTFEKASMPTPLNIGCGVTAYNYDDALNLLRERMFGSDEPPKVLDVLENVDVSKLDQKHVIPNMGSVTVRGIWFPMG